MLNGLSLTLRTLEDTVHRSRENVGCSWTHLQNPAEGGWVPMWNRQCSPLKEQGALRSYCISEWRNRCLKLISKAPWYPLALFCHFLLFDRRAATLTTFYNPQTVLRLKNTWLCLNVLQLHTGGRGWKQRPFIPNRILIHGSSCKALGLPPQKVNWSLYIIRTAVLTFLNYLAWNLCEM